MTVTAPAGDRDHTADDDQAQYRIAEANEEEQDTEPEDQLERPALVAPWATGSSPPQRLGEQQVLVADFSFDGG